MSNETAAQRADSMSQDAASSLAEKDFVRSARLAREALSIVPDNRRAREILETIQKQQLISEVPDLCRQYVQHYSDDLGNQAIQALKRRPQLSDEETRHCVELLLTSRRPGDGVLDQLTAVLLNTSLQARTSLCSRFNAHATDTYELLWNRGERSSLALSNAIADNAAWINKEDQVKAVQSIFQLSLGKLIDAGQDYVERAMTIVARLLATQSTALTSLLDVDTFEIIVPYLDIRQPAALRSQATLATVKLIEITKDTGQQHLKTIVTYHVGRGYHEDLIVAFSVAAAAFPILPDAAAALFMTEGFVQGLIPRLQRNLQNADPTRSNHIELAALEMFSAACINRPCRELVSKYAGSWLEDVAESSTDSLHASLAALVLAKVSGAPSQEGSVKDVEHLASVLTNMTLNSHEAAERQNALEGLAYTSLDPKIKESVASSGRLLENVSQILKDDGSSSSAVFGCLTLLTNITMYRPPESEEQKRMSQLKAYAESAKPKENDPLDDDKHVSARGKKVIEAGLVPPILARGRNATATILALIIQIIHLLSKEQKHRGLLAQQGAVKFLIQNIDTVRSTPKGSDSASLPICRTASHALARILISTNPNHVFSSALPASSAIRPLLDLLKQDPDAETRDLLPTFEALLALTNLASIEESNKSTSTSTVRDTLVRTAWPQIEDLLLSNTPRIQRAAVELVCNLMASPSGVAQFADGSKQAGRRMHILLALADSEDLATRKAAGGAMAMLTEWDAAVTAVLQQERAVKIVLGMCSDDDEDMKHRAVVCLLNIVSAPGEAGKQGLERVKKENGDRALKDALTKSKNPVVLQAGVEALKILTA